MDTDMRVLVVAEHNDGAINPSTSKTLSCVAELTSLGSDLLVMGNNSALAEQAARFQNVDSVLYLENKTFEHPIAAVMSPVIAKIAQDYDCVLCPSTTFGRDLMPRIAAALDVGQITDIMNVVAPRIFKRPIYAGNAIQTIEIQDNVKIAATVRLASYKEVETNNQATIKNIELPEIELPSHTRFLRIESEATERPDLQAASVVVSGGRAFGSSENFELLYSLADKLGAAVGASRAAVDAGYVPNDMQVGQTGKIISPDLYIAFGISGAIQHLAGIKDAGTIVAVNKDADAPIFEIADFGIVADLFEFIPEFLAKLG
jgi:electron transfer flavoprotein alpha subunit